MALKVYIKQNKNLKLCNISYFFFLFFFCSIGIYRAILLHLLIILSLPGPRGNLGLFLFFGTSKIKDLFCLSDLTVITPETAWHKQHHLSISSLFQHHLEEQWKTWDYEHIDQGTFWTLYLYQLTCEVIRYRRVAWCFLLTILTAKEVSCQSTMLCKKATSECNYSVYA